VKAPGALDFFDLAIDRIAAADLAPENHELAAEANALYLLLVLVWCAEIHTTARRRRYQMSASAEVRA